VRRLTLSYHASFAEHVLVGPECLYGQRRMHVGPGSDNHRIDRRVRQNVTPVVRHLRTLAGGRPSWGPARNRGLLEPT
jgi:hypothetical protein